MLHAALELSVRRLKKDSSYCLDTRISSKDLLEIIWHRTMGILRGFWFRPCFKRIAGVLFVGRDVSIRHGHHIMAGRNLTLEDGVSIEALSQDGIVIGDNVSLGTHVLIRITGTVRNLGVGLKIGDNTGIGAYCYLGAAGGITIGSNVSIGQRVNLHAENHEFRDASRLIADQGVTRQGIAIEDDCWIGSGSLILDGVTLHKGVVVGAGSVVTRSVEAYMIVAGVPARPIGRRGMIDENRP
jgi:acetyltransferase-like isoleucine patch superfamily enzyme